LARLPEQSKNQDKGFFNELCWLPTHELHLSVFSVYLDGGHVGGHRNAVNSSMQQRRLKGYTTYFATE